MIQDDKVTSGKREDSDINSYTETGNLNCGRNVRIKHNQQMSRQLKFKYNHFDMNQELTQKDSYTNNMDIQETKYDIKNSAYNRLQT